MKKLIEGRAFKIARNTSHDRDDASLLGAIESAPELDEMSGKFKLPFLDASSGDIVVAGRNFGAEFKSNILPFLKKMEIPCVIATSFGRGFYRGAINDGFPVIESVDAFEKIKNGEQISVDFEHNTITFKKGSIPFSPFPEIIFKILQSGGLLSYTRKALGK